MPCVLQCISSQVSTLPNGTQTIWKCEGVIWVHRLMIPCTRALNFATKIFGRTNREIVCFACVLLEYGRIGSCYTVPNIRQNPHPLNPTSRPSFSHSATQSDGDVFLCHSWCMVYAAHLPHSHKTHTHKQTHGNVSDWLSCIHTLIGEDIDFLRVMCAAVSVHSPLGFSWYFSMSLSLYFIIYFIVQDINACVCCVFVLYPSMILLWTYERQIMHLSNTHHFNSPYLYSVCSMILFYSSSFYQWCSQVPLHSSHPKVPMLRYMYIYFFL